MQRERPATMTDMKAAERMARKGGLVTAVSTSRRITLYCLCVRGVVSWIHCDDDLVICAVSREYAKKLLRE